MAARFKKSHGEGMSCGMELEALAGQTGCFQGRFEAIFVPGGGVFRQVGRGRVRKDPSSFAVSGSAPLSPEEGDRFRRQRKKTRPLVFDGGEGHRSLSPKEVLPSQAKELGAAEAGEDGETHLVCVGRRERGEQSPFVGGGEGGRWRAGRALELDLTPQIDDPGSWLDDGAHRVPEAFQIMVHRAFAPCRQTSRRPESDAGLSEILRREVKDTPARPIGGPPIGEPLLLARGEPMGSVWKIEGEEFGDGVVDRQRLSRREALLTPEGFGAVVKIPGLGLAVETAEMLHAAVHGGPHVPANLPGFVFLAIEPAFVLRGAGH